MPPTPPPPPPPQVAHAGEAAKREIKRIAREREIDVFMARDCIKKGRQSIEFLSLREQAKRYSLTRTEFSLPLSSYSVFGLRGSTSQLPSTMNLYSYLPGGRFTLHIH